MLPEVRQWELDEISLEVQIFSYKIKKFWGYVVQYDNQYN